MIQIPWSLFQGDFFQEQNQYWSKDHLLDEAETGLEKNAEDREQFWDWRKEMEDKEFNNGNEIPPKFRPIYAVKAFPNIEQKLTRYGDIGLVLKKDIEDRSTFTPGDSHDVTKASETGSAESTT